jgi:hypothetical protein
MFGIWDALGLGRFEAWNILRLGSVCILDALELGCFEAGTLSLDVLSLDVMS